MFENIGIAFMLAVNFHKICEWIRNCFYKPEPAMEAEKERLNKMLNDAEKDDHETSEREDFLDKLHSHTEIAEHIRSVDKEIEHSFLHCNKHFSETTSHGDECSSEAAV